MITLVKDCINKSIAFEPLKLCCEDRSFLLRILLRKLSIWGSGVSGALVPQRLTFIKDSIKKSIELGPLQLCRQIVHFH